MAPKQNPQFPKRRPGLGSAPAGRLSPTRPTKGASSLSAQASKYPCDFKTELPVPNWKQAHLTWPPYPGADWPSYVPPIAPASNLLMDSATGKIFFVGTDGYAYTYYWDPDHDWEIQPLNPNQGALIDPVGGLHTDATGKIYCIGTDKMAYNFYPQGGSWQFGALQNQWALIDARGGLAFDQFGKVFCIGMDKKVYNFYFHQGSRQFGALQNQWALIDARGGLVLDQIGKVFCIGIDQKAYNFYFNMAANSWQFGVLAANQYALIDARGGLALDNTGKVFGISTDGKFGNWYWIGNKWAFDLLTPNQYATIDARGKLKIDALGKVYGIGTDGNLYNAYRIGNKWAFDWLVQNPHIKADPIGGLSLDAVGKVFVIGVNGEVCSYYWTGTSWAVDALSPLQQDKARASNRLAIGDSVYFSSPSGHLEDFYYADSGINYNEWDLIYDEDFTTTTVPTLQNDWILHLPWGHTQVASILGGWEWGYNSENAFSISGGNLHITADNQPIWANLIDWQPGTDILSDGKPNYRQFDFTGGSMTTKAAYTYGLFEINCRFPAGKGFWPAFWLIVQGGWPPEIDVLEFDGTLPLRCSNNIFWRIDPNTVDSCSMEYGTSQDLTQAYHKYSMAWHPNKIIMYFDGRELRTIDHHIPQTPMQVIVGLGIGIHHPDAATPFPSNFDVDYLRFYKHK